MAWAMAASRASPAGWPRESLNVLNASRSSISVANGLVRAGLRQELAQLALEGAVVAQAGQRVLVGAQPDGAVGFGVLQGDRRLAREQLGQLEFVGAEVRLGVTHAPDVERADRLAVHQQRDDDHRLRLERRARDLDRARVQVGLVGRGRPRGGRRPSR